VYILRYLGGGFPHKDTYVSEFQCFEVLEVAWIEKPVETKMLMLLELVKANIVVANLSAKSYL
jgi:hypothetical protein